MVKPIDGTAITSVSTLAPRPATSAAPEVDAKIVSKQIRGLPDEDTVVRARATPLPTAQTPVLNTSATSALAPAPAEAGAAKSGVQLQAMSAGATQATAIGEDKLTKIFGVLDKLFKNQIFQGVLAILASIPGIGTVVSVVAGLLSLTNLVERWMSEKKPPDMVGVGSTLLYLGGMFVPGLGAFGGLLGMLRTPSEGAVAPQNPPATNVSAKAPFGAGGEVAAEAMLDKPYRDALTAVQDGLRSPSRASQDDFFSQNFEVLIAEQRRLAQLPASASEPDKQRASELAELFGKTLPQAVLKEGALAAYGLRDVAALAPTAQPTPGRFVAVAQPNDLATHAAMLATPAIDASTTLAAVRAYNGLAPLTRCLPGTWLYLPTSEQLQTFVNNQNHAQMASQNGLQLRKGLDLFALALQLSSSPDSLQARQVVATLDGMKPAPVVYDGSSEAGNGKEVVVPPALAAIPAT